MSAQAYDRRTVLKTIPVALGACALASACGDGMSAQSQGTVSVVGGMAAVTFAEFPGLGSTGGSTIITTTTGADIIVVRTGATTATATNAICSHQGCLVNYSASGMNLHCPCHGSQFSLAGQVIQGPAGVALKSYPATVGSSAIMVTVG